MTCETPDGNTLLATVDCIDSKLIDETGNELSPRLVSEASNVITYAAYKLQEKGRR